MVSLRRYADSTRNMDCEHVTLGGELPAQWPLIEAMFCMSLANSVEEYELITADLQEDDVPADDLRQVLDREAAINVARTCQCDMLDPTRAELYLRRWHGLACRHVEGIQPGHFKYTQNWIPRNPRLRRVEPALASTTFRRFISEIYNSVAPGYAHAAVVYLAVID